MRLNNTKKAFAVKLWVVFLELFGTSVVSFFLLCLK